MKKNIVCASALIFISFVQWTAVAGPNPIVTIHTDRWWETGTPPKVLRVDYNHNTSEWRVPVIGPQQHTDTSMDINIYGDNKMWNLGGFDYECLDSADVDMNHWGFPESRAKVERIVRKLFAGSFWGPPKAWDGEGDQIRPGSGRTNHIELCLKGHPQRYHLGIFEVYLSPVPPRGGSCSLQSVPTIHVPGRPGITTTPFVVSAQCTSSTAHQGTIRVEGDSTLHPGPGTAITLQPPSPVSVDLRPGDNPLDFSVRSVIAEDAAPGKYTVSFVVTLSLL